MNNGIWIVSAIVLLVVVYVIANVLLNVRRSRELWLKVDRSKLREWKDEEE